MKIDKVFYSHPFRMFMFTLRVWRDDTLKPQLNRITKKKLSNRLLLLLLLLSLFSVMIIQRVPSRFSHKKIEARNH